MSIDKHIKILKYIMYFLLIVSLIFGVIDKVNAEVINGTISNGGDIWSTNTNFYMTPTQGTAFANKGEGLFHFSLTMEGKVKLQQLSVQVNNKTYMCDFGTVQGYIDTDKQVIMVSAVCNLPTIGSAGIQRINWQVQNWGTNYCMNFGYYATLVVGTNNNYNSVLDSINNNLNAIKTYENWTNDDIQVIRSTTYDILQRLQTNNTALTDAINNQTQQQHQDSINTQNKINDIDNTLKDSSIDNPSTNTSNWGNMNASNGVITNLLTLPIQLMQGYVNGLNSSCTPFNLGNLFGTNITLPCINIGALIGSSLWGIIDILFSGFMIFGIAKKLIKIFNDFTNMKGNQIDELYGGGA